MSLLDERQTGEALGVALTALGVLLSLALLPTLTGGGADAGGADATNLIGPAGQWLHGWLSAGFGVAAVLVVVPAFAWGLYFFGVVGLSTAVRASILTAGGLLLVPPAVWLFHAWGAAEGGALTRIGGLGPGVPGAALADGAAGAPGGGIPGGWVGGIFGELLLTAFGLLGASLIVGALLVALSVLTLGWSPVRSTSGAVRVASRGIAATGSGLAAAGAGVLAAGQRGADWMEGRAARRAERRRERDEARMRDSASLWERAAEIGGGGPGLDGAAVPGVGGFGAGDQAELELAGSGAGAASAGPGHTAGFGSDADSGSGPSLLADPGDLEQMELPPLDLLTRPEHSAIGLGDRELQALGTVLVEKLRTFRVEGRIGGWTTGPVVTQFEVVPAAGVKVGQIAALADDLALALKAPSVRIVAPIPGKGAVGVEVPNPEPQIVHLREILETPAYARSRATLPLALGRNLAGVPYCADLARMPHLLIAGATGSGKSICINTIITSLAYRHPPRDLRMLMIDPKMVELIIYNKLPHLRHPVVTDNSEAAAILKWAVFEMNRRYALLSANACRNLGEFNQRITGGEEIRLPPGSGLEAYTEGTLPFIVLLIDELADLIMTVQSEVETPLTILAQKARAVGIHLVVATQRPSVNVITGLIKANFPCRIAFRVASKIDSRTILDQNGAESLLGNGDMLFLPPGEADPHRVQGAFLTTGDTERLLEWYRRQAELREAAGAEEPGAREDDILDVVRELEAEEARVDIAEEVLEDRDELFRQAAEVVITQDSGSTSLLQRRLKIGYGRAARIIDQLHHAGVLGPPDGSRPREVLVGLEQLDALVRGDQGGDEWDAAMG